MADTKPPPVRGPVSGGFTVYWRGLALGALLAGLLVCDNWQYLFHTPLYEHSDWAADSLFVRDAKHGALSHGQYSRWKFYHPGPVLFYVCAFGEWLFYDFLRVVPTPYNGQLLAVCAATACFLGLALAVFTQRLETERGGGRFFLPLALLFGVWHYGAAVPVAQVFLDAWPARPLVLVFLCFIVASSSVASGGGRELPLAVLTGGWLVHNHVALPLFVVPMTLLAYGGLLAWCRRETPGNAPPGWRAGVTAGWRTFPQAHGVAGGVLLLFLLPVVADLLRGSASNFHDILAHLREHHGASQKFPRSLCYFLIFGSYSAYNPAEHFFGRYSAQGMLAFLELHWRAYLGWVAVLALTPATLVAARRVGPAGTSPRRFGFLAWFGVMSLLAFVLTLVWGMKQDGQMFYFNAYFNFSIYYCAALGLAAALAVFLQAVTAPERRRRVRVGLGVGLALGAAAAARADAGRFQVHSFDSPDNRAAMRAVTETAAATLPAGGVCYLDYTQRSLWPPTVAVALQLERLGYRVLVDSSLRVMYGRHRTLAGSPLDFSEPFTRWTVVPSAAPSRAEPRWRLWPNCEIEVMQLADLDPAGGSIRFSAGGNAGEYLCFGWAPPDGDMTWTERGEAMLQFHPLPAAGAGGVDMILDAWSFHAPDSPVSQRVETIFNGAALTTVRLPSTRGNRVTVTLHIDAEQWRQAVARGFAKVLFRFPDARPALEAGPDSEDRLMGGGFRKIEFQPVP